MQIPCFSSINELGAVFQHGLRILFRETMTTADGFSYKSPIGDQGLIIVRASGKFIFTRPTDLPQLPYLEEQKVTLVHELIHAFHRTSKFTQFIRPHPLITSAEENARHKEYEHAIERATHRIAIHNHSLFEQIMYELSARPSCCFDYEVKSTPFYKFHARLLEKFLRDMPSPINMVDERQMRLFKLAERMKVSLVK